MHIPVTCPGCQANYKFGEALRGKMVRCPKCKHHIVVDEIFEAEEISEVLPVYEVQVPSPGNTEIPEVIPVAWPAPPRAQKAPPPLPAWVERPARSGQLPSAIVDTPGSFDLQPNELLLLAGSLIGGVFAWVWTICCLGFASLVTILIVIGALRSDDPASFLASALCTAPFLLFAAAIGLWPFLRSSTYRLTNRRLLWRSRLGRVKALPLEALKGCDFKVGPRTHSLHIRGRCRVSFRYIRGMERLWGALVFFRESGPLPLPQNTGQIAKGAWWMTRLGKGVSTQAGVAVLRPEYLAFLPSESSKNLLGMVGTELGLMAVGFQRITVETKIPYDVLMPLLIGRGIAEFDAFVCKSAKELDGVIWEPGTVEFHRRAVPFRPSKNVLMVSGPEGVIACGPGQQNADVAAIVDAWTGGRNIPVRVPVGAIITQNIVIAIPLAIFAWNGWLYHQGAAQDLGKLSAAQVSALETFPAGAFVTVTGRPDIKRISIVRTSGRSPKDDGVLVFAESPRLVVVCPSGQALASAAYDYARPATKFEKIHAQEGLARQWTVTGRLFPGDSSGDSSSRIPSQAVDDYAKQKLGLAGKQDVRVLVIGKESEDFRWWERFAFGVALGLGALALLAWLIWLPTLLARFFAKAVSLKE